MAKFLFLPTADFNEVLNLKLEKIKKAVNVFIEDSSFQFFKEEILSANGFIAGMKTLLNMRYFLYSKSLFIVDRVVSLFFIFNSKSQCY